MLQADVYINPVYSYPCGSVKSLMSYIKRLKIEEKKEK